MGSGACFCAGQVGRVVESSQGDGESLSKLDCTVNAELIETFLSAAAAFACVVFASKKWRVHLIVHKITTSHSAPTLFPLSTLSDTLGAYIESVSCRIYSICRPLLERLLISSCTKVSRSEESRNRIRHAQFQPFGIDQPRDCRCQEKVSLKFIPKILYYCMTIVKVWQMQNCFYDISTSWALAGWALLATAASLEEDAAAAVLEGVFMKASSSASKSAAVTGLRFSRLAGALRVRADCFPPFLFSR